MIPVRSSLVRPNQRYLFYKTGPKPTFPLNFNFRVIKHSLIMKDKWATGIYESLCDKYFYKHRKENMVETYKRQKR